MVLQQLINEIPKARSKMARIIVPMYFIQITLTYLQNGKTQESSHKIRNLQSTNTQTLTRNVLLMYL